MSAAPNEPPPEGSSGPQSATGAATAAQDVQPATDAAEGHTAAPALAAVLAVRDRRIEQLQQEVRRQIDAKVGIGRLLNIFQAQAAAVRDVLRQHGIDLGDDPAATVRDTIAVLTARAEQAEAAVGRVHAYLISLCDEPHPSHGHVCPDDVRRDILAALDQPQEQLQDPS